MKPFYWIMGILSFLVGILCLVNPFGAFTAIGILLSVFLLLVGFFFIFMFVTGKDNRVLSIDKPMIGMAGLILGIGLIVISILSPALPNMAGSLSMIILTVFSVWMLINGVVSVFSGMNYRKMEQRGGALLILIGVIVTSGGIYGLLHLVILGEALGTALGILLLIYGVKLLLNMITDPNVNGGDAA